MHVSIMAGLDACKHQLADTLQNDVWLQQSLRQCGDSCHGMQLRNHGMACWYSV
jgi:hypothetical protein